MTSTPSDKRDGNQGDKRRTHQKRGRLGGVPTGAFEYWPVMTALMQTASRNPPNAVTVNTFLSSVFAGQDRFLAGTDPDSLQNSPQIYAEEQAFRFAKLQHALIVTSAQVQRVTPRSVRRA